MRLFQEKYILSVFIQILHPTTMNKCSKCNNESVIIQDWLCTKCIKIALFGE